MENRELTKGIARHYGITRKQAGEKLALLDRAKEDPRFQGPSFWCCHECGSTGDYLSLASASDRTVAVHCGRHNRYERVPWDTTPTELKKKLRRRIEDRLRKDDQFLLEVADIMM